jgi:hypothetical protein
MNHDSFYNFQAAQIEVTMSKSSSVILFIVTKICV